MPEPAPPAPSPPGGFAYTYCPRCGQRASLSAAGTPRCGACGWALSAQAPLGAPALRVGVEARLRELEAIVAKYREGIGAALGEAATLRRLLKVLSGASSVPPGDAKCPECGKQAASPAGLTIHRSKAHGR